MVQGALAGSAPPATLALTTAHHGLAPPTTCYGATLGVLGTLSSAGSGMRQRHLVAGVVGGVVVPVVSTDDDKDTTTRYHKVVSMRPPLTQRHPMVALDHPNAWDIHGGTLEAIHPC